MDPSTFRTPNVKNKNDIFLTSPDGENMLSIKQKMSQRPATTLQHKSRKSQSSARTGRASTNDMAKEIINAISERQYYKTRHDFYHSSVSNFGKDAPHYTIGSSRKQTKVPPSTPGPGSYTPPSNGDTQSHLKYKPKFPIAKDYNAKGSKNVLIDGEIPPSINVGFIYQPVFPSKKPISIGISRNASKTGSSLDAISLSYAVNNYPGPSYLPQSTLSTRAHRIAEKPKVKPPTEINPGPGEYSPDPKYNRKFSNSPAYTCQGPSRRDEWLIRSIDYNVSDERTMKRIEARRSLRAKSAYARNRDINDLETNNFHASYQNNSLNNTNKPEFYNSISGLDNINIPNCTGPGPSDYSPNHLLVKRRPPEYTFGQKSRRTNRRKNPNQSKSRFIGIDIFIIPLDLSSNINADKKFIENHPEIKEMIHTIMEAILDEKPDEPMKVFREYFMELKKMLDANRPHDSESPISTGRLL